MSLHSYQSVDRKQLAKDINEIHQHALASTGIDDFEHLTKMERWGKMCSLIGYGTAWIFPNPISALLISQGSFTRWTQVAHPVAHKAYDKLEGVNKNYLESVAIVLPSFLNIPGSLHWHVSKQR